MNKMGMENLSGIIKKSRLMAKFTKSKGVITIFSIDVDFHHRISFFSIQNIFSKIYENLHYQIYP